MVGSYSVIKQNVLPYSITASDHEVEVYGANRIGLERSGTSAEAIEALQNCFPPPDASGLNTSQALARIEEELPQTAKFRHLLDFIRASQRGFVK